MTDTTRWAMVGTGFMLQLIGKDLLATENVDLRVLVSRTAERAAEAAAQHGVPEGSGDLDAVLARDDIDVVYVATPHTEHARIAAAALEAGKHVLVEKPMTTSAADTEALCALARDRGRFLMEAMWTAFTPAVLDVKARLAAGAVGEVRHLAASFALAFPRDPSARLWNPDLAGGSTLDQGVYALSLAHLLLGPPTAIVARGTIEDGIDTEAVVVLDHAGGAHSVCSTSMRSNGGTTAMIAGTTGAIELQAPFWGPDRFTQRMGPAFPGMPTEEVVHPREGSGYVPMLRAVSEAVLAGQTEHATRPHADSIAVAATMDEVLRQLHAG